MKGYTGICRNCKHDGKMTVDSPCYNCMDELDISFHKPDYNTEYANYEPKKEIALIPCPECEHTPHIGYACGEYFIVGTAGCPVCGEITEMHSSEQDEGNLWNRIADKERLKGASR